MEEKMKTLKDLEKETHWTDIEYRDRRKEKAVLTNELRQLAIEWIKQDIENSICKGKTELLPFDGDWILPGGKFCECDVSMDCKFHREGKRMMDFFTITEEELK